MSSATLPTPLWIPAPYRVRGRLFAGITMALSGHIRVMKTAQYLILNPHPNPLPGLGEGIFMVMTVGWCSGLGVVYVVRGVEAEEAVFVEVGAVAE